MTGLMARLGQRLGVLPAEPEPESEPGATTAVVEPVPLSPPCPVCAGPWLYGYTWRHTASCRLGAAEDATRAADHERLAGTRHRSLERDATPAEVELAATFKSAVTEQSDPTTVVRPIAGPVLHRTVAGVDPDDPTSYQPPPTQEGTP